MSISRDFDRMMGKALIGMIYDGFPAKTYSFTGEFVDTEKFDIVPKREYLDKEIARKEEELKHLQEVNKQHEERIREEISILKDQRDKRKRG